MAILYTNGGTLYINNVKSPNTSITTTTTTYPNPIVGWQESGNTYQIKYPGYTFVEWNTIDDGSGTSYRTGDSNVNNAYAIWDED